MNELIALMRDARTEDGSVLRASAELRHALAGLPVDEKLCLLTPDLRDACIAMAEKVVSVAPQDIDALSAVATAVAAVLHRCHDAKRLFATLPMLSVLAEMATASTAAAEFVQQNTMLKVGRVFWY
jgi:hypothetical protein